jgi:hypothetical protein
VLALCEQFDEHVEQDVSYSRIGYSPMDHSSRLRPALLLLIQAHEYCEELGCNPWNFAVEIDRLWGVGATNSDIRWLLHKGLLSQARESSQLPGEDRSLQPVCGLALANCSCFLLTQAGLTFVSGEASSKEDAVGPHDSSIGRSDIAASSPHWDKDYRTLRIDDKVVKQFKVPAPNQEIILASFEEDHWPRRIDDPLPLHPAIDAKRRLHDTINSLNRNQKHAIVHFMGDGSGEAICWELLGSPRVRIAFGPESHTIPEEACPETGNCRTRIVNGHPYSATSVPAV